MATHQLVIASAAKTDLKEIYQHGLRQWGQSQSDRYLETLKCGIGSLIEQPLMGIERPELLTGIRSFAIESHILFYRITTRNIEVVRVLHSRQDPMRQLK